MPKKKPAEAKSLVLAQRAPETYAAIVAIADLAAPFGQAVDANVTADNLDAGVEVVARVREAKRKLKALYDDAVATLEKEIASIKAEKATLERRLVEADEAVATRIIALYRDVDTGVSKRMDGKLGSTASVQYRSVKVTITDADKVPDKYVRDVPTREQRVDVKAVESAIMAGEVVPGVDYDPNYFLTTRAAEIVK